MLRELDNRDLAEMERLHLARIAALQAQVRELQHENQRLENLCNELRQDVCTALVGGNN